MSAFMGITESRERESWGSHVMAVRSVESVGGRVVVVWADGVTTRHGSHGKWATWPLVVSTSTRG